MGDMINKSRIAKNAIFLYIRMFAIMLVTLYTSRVVLNALGVEDYGVYNVVAGAVTLFGFMNSAMSMATQRFFNFYMAKNDNELLCRVFSMSLNLHIIIAVIVAVIAETFCLWLLNTQLNIPADRIDVARYVFHFAVISFCISVIQVPYNAVIVAHEKMDVYALISIVEVLLKLGVAYMLTVMSMDKLILYGILLAGVSLLIFFAYFSADRYFFKESRYRLLWDTNLFKEIAGFSGWNIFGQVSQVATTQGVNMVANVFCGVIVNASMGITNQVNGAMAQFTNNFQAAFRPQIIKSYSVGNIKSMQELVYQSSKFSFFLLYAISVPILFNIDFILDLWLGVVPEYSAVFCKLLIWYSYMETMGMPLVISIMATGRNRNYQLIVSVAIALNLVLSYLFLFKGFSPEVIFYVKILIAFFVLAIRLWFAKKQVNFSSFLFGTKVIRPVILVIVCVSCVQYWFSSFVPTLLMRISLTIILEIVLISSIWLLGVTKSEKQSVLSKVVLKIKR